MDGGYIQDTRCLLISSLPGKASRMLVESLSKPRDSTCVLEALPGKLYIKRREPGILFISLQVGSFFKLAIMPNNLINFRVHSMPLKSATS